MATTYDEFGNVIEVTTAEELVAQQNAEFAAMGGADDDAVSGSNVIMFDDGSSLQTFDDGSTLATDTEGNVTSSPSPESEVPYTPNSGTTVAAKAGTGQASPSTQSGTAAAEVPGKRIYNPLSNLSSYTYQISLYMCTPDAYSQFQDTGRRLVGGATSGFYLIAQSGGINNANSKRAPGFDLDLYIDDLSFDISPDSADTGGPGMTKEFTFKIFEPYGVSFPKRLSSAIYKLSDSSTIPGYKENNNPFNQFYMLAIRFYGYDKTGAIATRSAFGDADLTMATDESALFERFYDIKFQDLKFKLDGKLTVYNITAVQVDNTEAFGIKRGRINNRASVLASTVGDAIGIEGGDETTKSLFKILNEQEEQLVKDKVVELANVYKVAFYPENNNLSNSRLISVSDKDKFKWAPAPVTETDKSNVGTAAKAAPDKSKRELVFENDTPILQAITRIISQSSYVEDALRIVYTTDLDPDQPNEEEVKRKNPRKVKWFKVTPKLKVLGFDRKRNDYVYEITYQIHEYSIPYVRSDMVKNIEKYPGAYKVYNYLLTGKNTEVISYEQAFDFTFFVVSLQPETSSSNMTPKVPNRRQSADASGRLDDASETQNSIISDLADPGAFADSKIKIMGDPDYLMQSDNGIAAALAGRYYGQDGFSINPNNSQAFIEMTFKDAVDYNISSGLMTVNNKILFAPQSVSNKVNSSSIRLKVKKIENDFNKGKFEQTLTTTIVDFTDAKPGDGSGKADQRQTDAPAPARGTGTTEEADTEFGDYDRAVWEQTGYQQDDVTGLDEAIARNAADDAARKEGELADLFYTGSATTAPTEDGLQVADDDSWEDRDAADQALLARWADEGGRED